jgi:hypothetical protein
MLTTSKLQKFSIGCSAIAAAAFGGFVQPASAAEQFNPQGVQFDRDTIVEFEFLRSNNKAQSTFGVVNLATGERTPLIAETRATDKPKGTNYIGTPGKAVRKPYAEFTFQSNTAYGFYLESKVKGKAPVVVYSTPDKNGGAQVVNFDNDATALGSQGIKMAWNDGVSSNSSFDAFTVIAGGGVGCPCKASAALTTPLPPEAPPATTRKRIRGRG